MKRNLTIIAGLVLFATGLFAQTPPAKVSRGDVAEEQRVAEFSYIKLGSQDVASGYNLIASNNLPIAVGKAKDALERLALAKRAINRNAPRIEAARNWLGIRISDKDLADFRANLERIKEGKGTELEVSISNLIKALKGKGVDTRALERAYEAALRSDLWGTLRAIDRPNSTFEAATDPNAGDTTGSTAPAATTYTDKRGVVYTQRPDGVWVEPPGILLPGWTLNNGVLQGPKGERVDLRTDNPPTINASTQPPTLTDSSTQPPTTHAITAPGSGGGTPPGPQQFDPQRPYAIVGKNGEPITLPPNFGPWKDGVSTGVKRDYRGGEGEELLSETKVEARIRPLVGKGQTATIDYTDVEVRNWSFSVSMFDEKTTADAVKRSYTLANAAGAHLYTISSWQVDPSGSVSTEAAPGAVNSRVISYGKNGQYTVRVTGVTEWGSAFSVEIIEIVAGLH